MHLTVHVSRQDPLVVHSGIFSNVLLLSWRSRVCGFLFLSISQCYARSASSAAQVIYDKKGSK